MSVDSTQFFYTTDSSTGTININVSGTWQMHIEPVGRLALPEPVVPPVIQQALDEMGLDASYTAESLKKAYQRLAHERHPDKGGTAESFKLLTAAKQWLEKWISDGRPLVRIVNGKLYHV